ncbi:3-oxoacyl-[acyl-carrier-protein] reductase [Lentibacillus sp. JNUCC-1]|uniref:SDR family oxidoreductase n=1 Tax=Lentibacillus sp. JNUCC-1 TaxID=2654513 RepID=UPI0012E78931|nr:SDR family oxidoreductase [Lentibacillus sp. JNUCC-1]MUV37627.1 3-oxoacyl-[acyl-carrier-protein] reductase [Lentibacillus sp. JNUCC-1]
MTEQLKAQTAVVTGASSGIGAAIAKALVEAGANVVMAARNQDKLAGIAEAIGQPAQTLCVTADMTKQSDVANLAKQAKEAFGHVDIYVNNAGQLGECTVTSGAVSDWDAMIDVNVKGVLYGVDSVLPAMVEKGSGHIVNIASDLGFYVPKHRTVYSATKFAVRAISMGLEKELAHTGVRVSNISPGMVDTPLTTDSPFDDDRKKLDPTDIARAVVYAVTQPDYVNVNEITVTPK